MTTIEDQAQTVLETLIQMPFIACIPISKDFAGLTSRPGIYAVRHRQNGLLYIGKAQDIKERFRGGHKAITWAWLEDYDHRDVAIAVKTLDFNQWQSLSSELEGRILRLTKPPFNVRIPIRD